MSIKSKSKDVKFSCATLLILVGFLLAYFFYIKTKNEIINHPVYINYILFFIITGSLFSFDYNNFKTEIFKTKGNNLYLYATLNLSKILIIAWFLTGIVLIPFNYYNIHKSKGNPLETINCEIEGVSTYSKNRTVYFTFDGKTNVIYGFKPIMEDIKDNGKFKNYYFVAELRKGVLGSYILEDWSIQKK